MSERVNKVGVIIGGRGRGKTTFARGLMEGHPKKVLIVDTFDHPSYRDIPVLTLEQLPGWKKGIYRIYATENIDIDDIIEAINKYLTNALVFFEDALKYIPDRLKGYPIGKIIIDSKQKNLDLFFMLHGWGLVPPDLFRFCDLITVFKTNDSPADKKNQIPHFTEIMKLHTVVTEDPSPYANKTINVGN